MLNKNNKKKNISETLLMIFIVLCALAFLISFAFRTSSGYDWYPGR